IAVVVIGVLIFGAKKIPELARTFGKAKGEFEKGRIESEKELKDFKDKEDLK
ncbi:translocase, partial [Nitrosococcus oceani]